jgi:hypothetical protein
MNVQTALVHRIRGQLILDDFREVLRRVVLVKQTLLKLFRRLVFTAFFWELFFYFLLGGTLTYFFFEFGDFKHVV